MNLFVGEVRGLAPDQTIDSPLLGALSDLKRAQLLLRNPTPQALDECWALLSSAHSAMRQATAGIREMAGGRARHNAVELRDAIRSTATLLNNAAEYHSRWGRMLALMCAGYDASGSPADLACGGRLCLQG